MREMKTLTLIGLMCVLFAGGGCTQGPEAALSSRLTAYHQSRKGGDDRPVSSYANRDARFSEYDVNRLEPDQGHSEPLDLAQAAKVQDKDDTWPVLLDRSQIDGEPLRLTMLDDGDGAGAAGADNREDSFLDEWRFEIAPYFFAPDADVRSTVDGMTATVDLSFGDVADSFDVFGLAGRAEAWRGDVGFFIDATYVDMEAFVYGPGPAGVRIGIDIEQAVLDVGAGYRVLTLPLGKQADGEDAPARLAIDALGGMRYGYLKQKIRFTPGPTLGGSKDWVEPLVGARAVLKLGEHFDLNVRGDASGFSVGSASKLTWNAIAGVNVHFTENVAFEVAYRINDIEYMTGSGANAFGLDGRMAGPMVSLKIRW